MTFGIGAKQCKHCLLDKQMLKEGLKYGKGEVICGRGAFERQRAAA
jgi:hypothetical protein